MRVTQRLRKTKPLERNALNMSNRIQLKSDGSEESVMEIVTVEFEMNLGIWKVLKIFTDSRSLERYDLFED
jgi:hypothetical protein